ncbi:hypothetical protein EXN66_Car007917 [Channa argus]|uniref:Uncharacterized protein n=1 Tax=Channa argus TaxID=215402 RepID=A0A6G1PPG8_CHAAH|nr:hypothetical protein EXN66_Car007917 [Channa argus]
MKENVPSPLVFNREVGANSPLSDDLKFYNGTYGIKISEMSDGAKPCRAL